MKLKDFEGCVVISAESKRRYIIGEITAPYIAAVTEERDARGNRASYRWRTINGDPISTGQLIFEDAALKRPFLAAYEAHCRSEMGRAEEYLYWSRMD